MWEQGTFLLHNRFTHTLHTHSHAHSAAVNVLLEDSSFPEEHFVIEQGLLTTTWDRIQSYPHFLSLSLPPISMSYLPVCLSTCCVHVAGDVHKFSRVWNSTVDNLPFHLRPHRTSTVNKHSTMRQSVVCLCCCKSLTSCCRVQIQQCVSRGGGPPERGRGLQHLLGQTHIHIRRIQGNGELYLECFSEFANSSSVHFCFCCCSDWLYKCSWSSTSAAICGVLAEIRRTLGELKTVYSLWKFISNTFMLSTDLFAIFSDTLKTSYTSCVHVCEWPMML